MDDFNLTKEEINILAPPKSVVFGAFKASVTMGATIFFAEKIANKLFTDNRLFSEKNSNYALLAGLVGGAIGGIITTVKNNNKIKKFTQRLDAEIKSAENNQQNYR